MMRWVFLLSGPFFALLAAPGCDDSKTSPAATRPDNEISCAHIVVGECPAETACLLLDCPEAVKECRKPKFLECKELGSAEYLKRREQASK